MARSEILNHILAIYREKSKNLSHQSDADSNCNFSRTRCSSHNRCYCDSINLMLLLHDLPTLCSASDATSLDGHWVGAILSEIGGMSRFSDLGILDPKFVRTHAGDCDIGPVMKREITSIMDNLGGLPLEFEIGHSLPDIPTTLCDALSKFRSEHPQDLFEHCLRYTARNQDNLADTANRLSQRPQDLRYDYLPRIKCLDCPAFLIPLGHPQRFENIEKHINTPLHKERVAKRLGQSSDK